MLIKSIANLVENLSSETKKSVELDYAEFNGDDIPGKYRLLVKDILIQLVRNSLVHGIETDAERSGLKKDRKSTIRIATSLADGRFKIFYRDDGRGIQLEKLVAKARESGKWKESEIRNWDKNKIAAMIYESGISTSEKPSLHAGRGVGMDIIKQKIDSHHGEIKLDFEKDKFTVFQISLPV